MLGVFYLLNSSSRTRCLRCRSGSCLFYLLCSLTHRTLFQRVFYYICGGRILRATIQMYELRSRRKWEENAEEQWHKWKLSANMNESQLATFYHILKFNLALNALGNKNEATQRSANACIWYLIALARPSPRSCAANKPARLPFHPHR